MFADFLLDSESYQELSAYSDIKFNKTVELQYFFSCWMMAIHSELEAWSAKWLVIR